VPVALSALARIVLRALEIAPGTPEELARETKLPAGVVDSALAELRNAGRTEEFEPKRWRTPPEPDDPAGRSDSDDAPVGRRPAS
jgi:hypothetical protein